MDEHVYEWCAQEVKQNKFDQNSASLDRIDSFNSEVKDVHLEQ